MIEQNPSFGLTITPNSEWLFACNAQTLASSQTLFSIISNRILYMKTYRSPGPPSIIQNPSQLNFQIKFAEHINQASIRLSFKQQGNRIVIPRKQTAIPNPIDTPKARKDRRAAIQSANVSRQKIDVEEEGTHAKLQFSKDQKSRLKNLHKRTKSNHVELYEIKEDQMSNFSNSLQNISQEIIEIPFARQVFTPAHQKIETSWRRMKNSGSLEHSNRSSIEKRVTSPILKLAFQKKSVEKSRNKQNCPSHMDKQLKLQKSINIPRPKAKQLLSLSLSDFNLKAIKITEGGSIVYLAAHKYTNCIVAIKSIKKKTIKPIIQSFVTQLKLGLLLNSPNVAKIYGFFTDNDNFYVIKEYMEEGCITERRKKIGENQIGCEINQILNGVLSVVPLLGSHWTLDLKNIAQTHSISKITTIKVNLKGTDECFSERLKACFNFLLDTQRKSQNTKDFFETNESIHLNMLRHGSYLLCSFRQMLESILILTENQILMLWQAHFLKQYRFKALMHEQN